MSKATHFQTLLAQVAKMLVRTIMKLGFTRISIQFYSKPCHKHVKNQFNFFLLLLMPLPS